MTKKKLARLFLQAKQLRMFQRVVSDKQSHKLRTEMRFVRQRVQKSIRPPARQRKSCPFHQIANVCRSPIQQASERSVMYGYRPVASVCISYHNERKQREISRDIYNGQAQCTACVGAVHHRLFDIHRPFRSVCLFSFLLAFYYTASKTISRVRWWPSF